MNSNVDKIKRCDVVIVKKCTKKPKTLPAQSSADVCHSSLEQREFLLDTENDDGVLVLDHYLDVKTKHIEKPEVVEASLEDNNCLDNPFDINLPYLKDKIPLPVIDMKPLLFHETLLMCEDTGNLT